MPTMQEAYVSHVGDMDPDSMDTLFLDNSTTRGRIFGLAPKYENLAMLSMVNCNLTTLVGLPHMPSLSYLDISRNQLGDQAFFESLVQKIPVVEKISMCQNELTFTHLRPLRNLPKLSELDLANNPSLGINYRDKIFQMLPSLKILDGCDVDGEEVDDTFREDDEGEDELDGEDLDEEHHQDLHPQQHQQHHRQGQRHRGAARPQPPHRVPASHRAAPVAPGPSQRVGGHQIHRPIAQHLVPPHRLQGGRGGAAQGIAHGVAPAAQGAQSATPHTDFYMQYADVKREEEVVEEELDVVDDDDEDEYVDVDGLDPEGEEGEGGIGDILDDSEFTYNESAYYDPEDSISATIDAVIASTSGRNQQQPQQQRRISNPTTRSPRGVKRAAPTVSASTAPSTSTAPTTAPAVVAQSSSSGGEEIDVEGVEPEAKKVAVGLSAPGDQPSGASGPEEESDDDEDLNVA